jgi:hypothetical protein
VIYTQITLMKLTLEKVASMHEASPEYIERRFQGMMVIMKHGIANWELSGMGDGAYDRADDDDEAEEDEGDYQARA